MAALAPVPLEVADDPCLVLLSSTGLLARTSDASPLPASGDRSVHDVLVSAVRSTVRGEVGVVTSLGRMIRVSVVDLPMLPASANPPSLAGGHPVAEYVSLAADESVVGIGSLDPDGPGLALGTEQGVVKRVVPDYPANRDEFEVIGLKDGDTVVGAVELTSEDHDLVFITSDAQLLRYPATNVRPQGRPAGGMAGIRIEPGAKVIWFGALDPNRESCVVTIAGSSTALPGTQIGGGKISDYAEFPAKGRATAVSAPSGSSRAKTCSCWPGPGPSPAKAVSSVGKPVPLPDGDRPPRRLGRPADPHGLRHRRRPLGFEALVPFRRTPGPPAWVALVCRTTAGPGRLSVPSSGRAVPPYDFHSGQLRPRRRRPGHCQAWFRASSPTTTACGVPARKQVGGVEADVPAGPRCGPPIPGPAWCGRGGGGCRSRWAPAPSGGDRRPTCIRAGGAGRPW